MKNNSNILWLVLQIITIPMWLINLLMVNVQTSQINASSILEVLYKISIAGLIYLFTANIVISVISFFKVNKEAALYKPTKIMSIANLVLGILGIIFVTVLFVGVVTGAFAG